MLNRAGLFIIFIIVISQVSAVDSAHYRGHGSGLAKRALDSEKKQVTGDTEGGIVGDKSANHAPVDKSQDEAKKTTLTAKPELHKVPDNSDAVKPLPVPKEPPVPNGVVNNATTTKNQPAVTPTDDKVRDAPKNVTEPDPLEMNNPAAVKRALIVFGGFLILAIAYWLTIGRKSKTSETNNNHNINDSNQFRYGVLEPERGDDNMELSRIPLTMESDDEDDDDLEIFDLGQKKKSLSYVNLQTNEDDVDIDRPHDHYNEHHNKSNLIDIGDGDTLINLQSDNSSKFVL